MRAGSSRVSIREAPWLKGLGRFFAPRRLAAAPRFETMSGIRYQILALTLAAVTTLSGANELRGQSLGGSSRSLDRQNRQAELHDFTYLGTATQLRRFVDAGYLVPVRSNRDFELHDVGFPYARPEVELFIRRLASQYRAGCGEKLVVTSLTRPLDFPVRNASDRSVHPTGMALDLRRPASRCRAWLEAVLLDLEGGGVLEATRERTPAHYHVAIFPEQYSAHVANMTSRTAAASSGSAGAGFRTVEYRVRPGDSLWTIAQSHGTTVNDLKSENGLRSSTIYAGQIIAIPRTR